MGYTITSTNYDTPDYVEYEIVKGDQTYEVQIDVDDETGNATDVEVEANLWKTNPTEAAVEANERDASERTAALRGSPETFMQRRHSETHAAWTE